MPRCKIYVTFACMSKILKNANHIVSDTGEEYHIQCKKGDLAEHIILVGSPERSLMISRYFNSISFSAKHREFHTYTGIYKNCPISVMSTGIGPASMEIALIESSQVTDNPTYIRCGSSGAMQTHIKPGDLVVSQASMRMEDTTSYFVPMAFPAVANHGVTRALMQEASKLSLTHHLGITASTSGFYGAQNRTVAGLPQNRSFTAEQLQSWNIANCEMETSTLFTLAYLKGLKAGAVCAIYANRINNTFANEDTKVQVETNCISLTLNAMVSLFNTKGSPVG